MVEKSEETASTAERTGTPTKVVFRHPNIGLVAVFIFLVCMIPLAGAWFHIGLGWLLLLVPIGIGAYLVRTKTTVTDASVTAVHLFGRTVVPWDQIAGVRLRKSGAIKLVRTDKSEVALPAVDFGQLPRLSVASAGRVPNPYDTLAADE